MITLIVIALIMGYFGIGGMAHSVVQRALKPKCTYSSHDIDCCHVVLAGLAVPFWPIITPVLVGKAIVSEDKDSRTLAKRQKEIEEAEHDAKVAAIRARESADLDRQLAASKR